MAIVYLVKEKYLRGNPISIEVSGLAAGTIVNYQVLHADESKLFSGVFYSYTDTHILDISSLFSTQDTLTYEEYKVKFETTGVGPQTFSFSLYAGAINKPLQRKLHDLGKDIFEVKLHNVNANFFLSTRSFSRYIFIRENELMPLLFYIKGKRFGIYAGNNLLNQYNYLDTVAERLNGIDLSAIRQKHFTDTGRLCNVFDIRPLGSNVVTTTIVITESKQAKHFIKFRNSFLAFEMMSIDDEVSFESEFEYADVQGYDEAIHEFIVKQQEKKIKSKFSVSISAKNNSEMLWILDMLLSKEQYFIVNGYEYPVLVRSSDTIFQSSSGTPLRVSLEIEMIDKDSAFSPTNMDSETDIRVFNDIFNNIFS